jgi:hypothetical protein
MSQPLPWTEAPADGMPLVDAAPAAPRSRTGYRLVPIALFAIVLLIAILTVTPWPVGAFQDDAIYTVLAKALATGQGYRMINLPGSPHATHYPPGYPAFLALLWKLWPDFPDNIVVFKFANTAILAFAALGTYWFARRRLQFSELAAAGCALVGTVSIILLLITGVVLSEPMFMALLLPALLFAEYVADDGDIRDAALAGALFGVLALVRTLGIFAIPAAALVLVVRKKVSHAVILCVTGAIVLAPWQIWVSRYQSEIPSVFVGKYGSYSNWLAEGYRAGGWLFAKAVLVANAQSLDGLLSFMFMPVQAVWPRGTAVVLLTLTIIAGAIVLARRAPVSVVFVAIYMVVIMAWPFEPNRFILPLWPLFVFMVAVLIRALWNWRSAAWPARALRLLCMACIAYLLVGYTTYNVEGYTQRWWASVQRDTGTRAKPLAEWVAKYTQPTDVLSTDHDLIIYLYTGRQAMPTSTFTAAERLRALTPDEDAAILRTILATYKPRYFITGSAQGVRAATRLQRAKPPELRMIGSMKTAVIYESLPR